MMHKKAIVVITIALIAVAAVSGCAMFKAAKAPVKDCLTAWKKGKLEEAYSYFSDEMKANYPFETFKEYAEAYPVKKFNLNNISISADGTGEVKGTVTIKGGEQLGCLFKIVEVSEDEWTINGLQNFSKDLIP
jgi:hypothetical protein